MNSSHDDPIILEPIPVLFEDLCRRYSFAGVDFQ